METQLIHRKIHDLRGQRVMLDFDLAELYGVPTKVLNQSVRRNPGRFPEDFMFRLTMEEWRLLRPQILTLEMDDVNRSQFVTGSQKHREARSLGVAMLSSMLKSNKAIQTNIAIMRAFVALRRYGLSFAELVKKVLSHDKQLDDINEVLKWLGE